MKKCCAMRHCTVTVVSCLRRKKKKAEECVPVDIFQVSRVPKQGTHRTSTTNKPNGVQL